MANIYEVADYTAAIAELSTSDFAIGGPDGKANLQAKQLANRTAYLKGRVDSAEIAIASNASAVEKAKVQCIPIACSDESTALTAGMGKITFRMPYAFTLTEVRASLTTAQSSGSIFTVDINESNSSVLSTKLTIDNTEKTSKTADAPAVISDASLADDAEITIDIDQIGDGTAKGLKVYLIGYKS